MLASGCRTLRNRQLLVRLKYALQHAEASWGTVKSTTSVACDPCVLPVAYPAYMIWGANTDVGKTLFSAGLAAAASRRQVWNGVFSKQSHTTQAAVSHSSPDLQVDLSFIKPVQTGFPSDSDARLVVRLTHSRALQAVQKSQSHAGLQCRQQQAEQSCTLEHMLRACCHSSNKLSLPQHQTFLRRPCLLGQNQQVLT